MIILVMMLVKNVGLYLLDEMNIESIELLKN